MRAAIVSENVVTNVILLKPDADPADFGAIACPDNVSKGWSYDGTDFAAPPPPDPFAGMTAEEKKDALYAYAGSARSQKQVAGTTVDLGAGPMPISTDSTTQLFLSGARIKAEADANYTIHNYKLAPGQYATLTAAAIVAISDAVEAYIQSCFDKNKDVDADIDAGTISTTDEIDQAFAAL